MTLPRLPFCYFTVLCLVALLHSAAIGAETKGFRASIIDYIGDPEKSGDHIRYFADGLMVVKDGKVLNVGEYSKLTSQYPTLAVKEYRNALITPGYIDAHVHYPQVEMIAAFGEQLLEWLATYTFPTEITYANRERARQGAGFFLDQLLKNGVTTALVFTAVYKDSADAFFEEAQKRKLRMIAGKVLMDRNAPVELTDTPQTAYDDSKALIEKWHGKDRLLYAVTPRFAPTSSAEQLTQAGRLVREFPGVYMHTHVSENLKEIAWVKSLFPAREGYVDVYDHYGLIGPRSVLAHAVHLTDKEVKTIADKGAGLAFCSTSNLFLGSGLFPLHRMEAAGIRVAFGSDVGAGTSLSNFRTQNEAYKIMQLQGQKLSAHKAFYLSTLGGARALYLDDKIGNFEIGKEADFVVLDLKATELMAYRLSFAKNIDEILFAIMMMGDDRLVKDTYVLGELAYQKD